MAKLFFRQQMFEKSVPIISYVETVTNTTAEVSKYSKSKGNTGYL